MSSPQTTISSAETQNMIRNEEHNDSGDENNNGFPDQSTWACPVDMSCLWTGPKWAVSAWMTSAAGMLGLGGGEEGNAARRRGSHQAARNTRYVPLVTSTDSVDTNSIRSGSSRGEADLDDSDNVANQLRKSSNSSKNTKTKPSIDTTVNQNFGTNNILTGISQATTSFLGTGVQSSVQTPAEFDVWQKYIKDLSNFAALDVDVSIVASSSDRANPCPYIHLTIRGPIIPALGRCRRTLENSAFIAPQSNDEWQEANPIAVLEVVEAFLLSVVAPESVEDDDAIETIIETGTHILAHPALELQEFLNTVADFVKQKCLGVKLIVRDIDFTAEFDNTRQQHAERFLVLDYTGGTRQYLSMMKPSTSSSTIGSSSASTTSSNMNTEGSSITAREPRTSSSSYSMTNVFSGRSALSSTGIDNGCCPESAVASFEADYTMLDIVRACRNLIRRVVQNIPSLKSIEIRGCLVRDTDLDVNGIFAGRTSSLRVLENDHDDGDDVDDGEQGTNKRHRRTRSTTSTENFDGEDDHNDRCFPYRSGFVRSEIKRVTGPSRLVIEHCGLHDAHITALIRVLRVETEKCKRNTTSSNSDSSSDDIVTSPFLSSLSSLRLSGQFYPMTLMGLLTGMQDSFDDLKLSWARRNKNNNKMTPEDRAARIPFPLDELEVPNGAVHTVREALVSRGLGYKEIEVRAAE